MATFRDLSDKERIQSIKDALVLILEGIIALPKDPAGKDIADPAIVDASRAEKLAKYIDIQKPIITEATPSDEKAKLEASYQMRQATFEKVMGYIRGIQKVKGCVCQQGCFDITITNSVLPPEFEPLLVAARKIAENRAY